ncbi:MAG: glycosyl transferase [Kutzneria sp.]|nr:glycosyl transferase [Kutzneria sp.]
MSRHVVFVLPPAHGHVNPTLPLVRELLRRGHRVSYATGPELLPAVRETGATPVELPWALDTEAIARTLADADRSTNSITAKLAWYLRTAKDYFPVLAERFQHDRPDMVCCEKGILGSALADRFGVPEVTLVPYFASNEHFDVWTLVLPRPVQPRDPDLLDFQSGVAAFTAEHRLRVPLMAPHKSNTGVNLVFIPREFQVAGDTFDETFHFVGPSVGAQVSGDWQPPQDDAPVLFISLGTIMNNQPEFFTLCAKAFGDSAWHVAMATGKPVNPATLGDIPANFEVRPYFPQTTVLRHATAFLSHAGMNSTMDSLYHAVPLIAVPQQPEQVANADRVEELGLGRCLEASTLTADLLRNTVDEVANSTAIRTNLARFSQTIRTSGGATAGADILEARLSATAP